MACVNSGFPLHAAFSKIERGAVVRRRVRPNCFAPDSLATLAYVLLNEMMLRHSGHVLPFPG